MSGKTGPREVIEPPEVGWNDRVLGHVVKVTEHWVVIVTPMIYNDRICLSPRDGWDDWVVAGWCYDKGGSAHLAALVWDPETQPSPAGYKKAVFDSRSRTSR